MLCLFQGLSRGLTAKGMTIKFSALCKTSPGAQRGSENQRAGKGGGGKGRRTQRPPWTQRPPLLLLCPGTWLLYIAGWCGAAPDAAKTLGEEGAIPVLLRLGLLLLLPSLVTLLLMDRITVWRLC